MQDQDLEGLTAVFADVASRVGNFVQSARTWALHETAAANLCIHSVELLHAGPGQEGAHAHRKGLSGVRGRVWKKFVMDRKEKR